MSQRVALARARSSPEELRLLADAAVDWWRGAPALAHAVAAGAYAAAGDLDASAREVAIVGAAGGWRAEGSYLQSVLVVHLAEAAIALGDIELCNDLLTGVEHLVASCGVNGAIVAFAGPFAHTAGTLAAALGDQDKAHALLGQSVATAQRLGATVWVRSGDAAIAALARTDADDRKSSEPVRETALLSRMGKVWTFSWQGEQGTIVHAKGIADISTLIRHQGQDVSALALAGGGAVAGSSHDQMIDIEALNAYRRRLDELTAEMDRADADADMGRSDLLQDEHDQLIAEIKRATGLGGRLRGRANDPAERARKAVSARIRDAISRLESLAPSLAAHLDRSVQTGLHCSYSPGDDEAPVRWIVEG
jgi:hypothetical protein